MSNNLSCKPGWSSKWRSRRRIRGKARQRQPSNPPTRALEDAIRKLPEVIACHYISGSGTFELQVMATDLDAFSRFSLDTLLNLPNVKDLHTSFSLGEVKAGAALPLSHLKPAAR